MVRLATVTEFLNRELRIGDFTDSSNNGLQVAGPTTVRRICCGVDASQPFITAAAERKADLLICHHGLSWGDSLKYITGLNYNHIAALVRANMALYGAHLPLDAHPRYGNNALIAKELGLTRKKPFGWHRGQAIGFEGQLPRAMSFASFCKRVAAITGRNPQVMAFGKASVRRVAVVSGGAAGDVAEAGEKGMDVFLTGEPVLTAYHDAQEHGINAVFAGHYATEVFGVRQLASVLTKRFNVRAEFIDFDIPF